MATLIKNKQTCLSLLMHQLFHLMICGNQWTLLFLTQVAQVQEVKTLLWLEFKDQMLMTITNLHQKTFQQGWGGTCHRKSVNHTNVRPQIKDYTKNNLEKLSKLDMFLLFFPFNYLENLIVIETSKTLVGQAHSQLLLGDFVRFLGCKFSMSCFSGVD